MEFLAPGRTCWRVEEARRVAFLVDYQAYYQALLAALPLAQRQILLLGWSFDPRTRLMPNGEPCAIAPDQIGRILMALAAERPRLEIRVLVWRSALAVSATQDFFPHRAKGWFGKSRVGFRLDDTIPFGACHHQKVVVVDDQIALVGSGDICGDRWDTPAHLDRDARRRNPKSGFHPARHELMVMAQGPIAAALGDLARRRWREAGGEEAAPAQAPPIEWPPSVPVDVENTRLAISRTEPHWKFRAGVSEIAQLTAAAIAGAKTSIYMENQYFTSPAIAEALAARLAEPDGPEVVLVSTHQSVSYFDQLTMDRTRAVFLWRLISADIFGRLRVFAPYTLAGVPIIVHAKAMIVDDRLARIGSANLNNRSQGFDTECEVALEAEREDERAAIARLVDTLVGHWLDRGAAQFAAARARCGGLIAAITELNRHERLRPIEPERLGPLASFIADFHIGDPVGAEDSWAPFKRRERIYQQVRSAPKG